MALTPELTAEEKAQGERCASSYSNAAWSPSTPYGLGRDGAGPRGLYVRSLRDFVGFGRGVVRVATEGLAELRTIIARFESAVAAIQAGPVTSVRVGDGPAQSGAVVVDLSTLSADVEASLEDLRVAQVAIEARAASAQAYSLAFGG